MVRIIMFITNIDFRFSRHITRHSHVAQALMRRVSILYNARYRGHCIVYPSATSLLNRTGALIVDFHRGSRIPLLPLPAVQRAKHLDEFRPYPCPPRLVTRPEACAVVAVEVLIEEDVVTSVRVGLELLSPTP